MADKKLESHISEIIRFISQFRWIIDAYVSDFFVLGHWQKLPSSWQDFLEDVSPPELSYLIDNHSHERRKVWPLSLLCYKACIKKLSLNRQKIDVQKLSLSQRLTESISSMGQSREEDKFDETTKEDHKSFDVKSSFFCGQYEELYHIYRRHVKPKKQHEIHQLGQVISELCECCGCENIVDIGAGLGHLSRLLTFGLGLKVTTVEATDGHAPKATTFDREMDRELKKKKLKTKGESVLGAGASESLFATSDVVPPSHIVHWIEPSVSMHHFIEVLNLPSSCEMYLQSKANCCDMERSSAREIKTENKYKSTQHIHLFCDSTKLKDDATSDKRTTSALSDDNHKKTCLEISVNNIHTGLSQRETTSTQSESGEINHTLSEKGDYSSGDFVLCGLHACGDLTPTMLRLFVRCPRAVGLNSVGCCYMKLSCEGSPEKSPELGYPMSGLVQKIPDHSLSYSAREMACHFVDSYLERLRDDRPNLIVHSYRAALQQIILEKNPDFQRGALKITVKKAEQMDFIRYAEIGLKKVGLETEISEKQLADANRQISQWKDVVSFYTIRLALAPVVETLILLDRVQYLKEQGIPSILLPVFDPSLSPRNFVLLARKRLHE